MAMEKTIYFVIVDRETKVVLVNTIFESREEADRHISDYSYRAYIAEISF